MLASFLERSTTRARIQYGRARKRVRLVIGRGRFKYFSSVYESHRLTDNLARDARMPERASLAAIVLANLEAHGEDLLELRLHQALYQLTKLRLVGAANHLLHVALEVLSDERAIDLAEAHIHYAHGSGPVRVLAKLYSKHGFIKRPEELMRAYVPGDGDSVFYRRLASENSLILEGMPYSPARQASFTPAHDRKILYHVSQCPPHHNSGYAIRTHWLVQTLRAKNWDLEVFARYGYPNDRYDFLDRALAVSGVSVDGIEYHFSPDPHGFRTLSAQEYHRQSVRVLCEQGTRFRPALLHTASNQIVGLAGTEAATRLGIPSVYEMRGLWHMTRASKKPYYLDSEHYQMTQALEIQAARQADHVFAITAAIRDVLLADGIPDQKITVVPNAVDTTAFTPRAVDRTRAVELGIGDELIIGFIGSFAFYEGLDLLLHAGARLRGRDVASFRLLLVGDGEALADLKVLARDLGIENMVTFTGRVAHDEVPSYYSLFDIAAYPRKGLRVCEVVSPLKPYEAMAMEKAVIVSDVQALAEMVQDGRTGLVHAKDDIEDLARSIERLLRNQDLRLDLGRNARKWLLENRTWERVTERIEEVYAQLIG